MRHDDMTAATQAPEVIDLDEFVAQHYPAVVAAVALITGDRPSAEDAVQDALVTLLTRPPAEPLRSVAAWVTVVASNRARSAHRRRGAEGRALDRLGRRSGQPEARLGDPRHVADSVDVTAAIGRLPEQQRQVCVLHYYLDASVAEIGGALGVTEGTVKTQLHRARRSLASALDEPEPGNDLNAGGNSHG